MGRKTLREKQLGRMAGEILKFKDIAKKWYNHACIRYLQQHELTDEQEALLEEVSEFIINATDTLSSDNDFIKKVLLPPVKLPQKKVKA